MAIYKYPDEIAEFIQNNVAGRTTKELVSLLNTTFSKKYGIEFTESKMKSYKANHKLTSGTPCGTKKGTSVKFPDGMMEYVTNIAVGRSSKEIARMISEHFGICFSQYQCHAYKKNHGITSGINCRFVKGHEPANKGKHQPTTGRMAATQFKKGNHPHNHMQVGDLTHTTDGYLVRKIAEPNKWEFVHRATWIECNGPIPEGKIVTFANCNKDDCDIDNLILIDKDTNLEMNRRKYRTKFREITKTGTNIAKLTIATRKMKKQLKKHKEGSHKHNE